MRLQRPSKSWDIKLRGVRWKTSRKTRAINGNGDRTHILGRVVHDEMHSCAAIRSMFLFPTVLYSPSDELNTRTSNRPVRDWPSHGQKKLVLGLANLHDFPSQNAGDEPSCSVGREVGAHESAIDGRGNSPTCGERPTESRMTDHRQRVPQVRGFRQQPV